MVRRRRSQSSLATKLVLIVNQGLMLPGKQQLAHSFLERNGPFVRFLRVASPGIRVQTVNNFSTPLDQDALLAQRCEPLANLVVEGWRLRFVNAQLHDGNLTLWINGGGAPPKRHGRAPSVRQVAPAAEPATAECDAPVPGHRAQDTARGKALGENLRSRGWFSAGCSRWRRHLGCTNAPTRRR